MISARNNFGKSKADQSMIFNQRSGSVNNSLTIDNSHGESGLNRRLRSHSSFSYIPS